MHVQKEPSHVGPWEGVMENVTLEEESATLT